MRYYYIVLLQTPILHRKNFYYDRSQVVTRLKVICGKALGGARTNFDIIYATYKGQTKLINYKICASLHTHYLVILVQGFQATMSYANLVSCYWSTIIVACQNSN